MPLDLDGTVSQAEAATVPGQNAGDAAASCDSAIIPIYPVRYGYANLFDRILAPAAPPPLQTLLNATSVEAGRGYVTRLLRPGWVFIKEEVGGSHLQIFEYRRSESSHGGLVETFQKQLFENGYDASDGLRPDTSAIGGSYPFAFVSKGISEISIVYTEHLPPASVISKMHGDAAFREKAMQRVNIVSGGRDAVEAGSGNIGRLIEDYRNRQDRALVSDGIQLDVLTAEVSLDLDPDLIAQQIRNKLCYDESAMIVALHDPLGRQQELTQAHAKLSIWEQDHAAQTIYPYTIGQFVKGALDSDNEDVREAAQDNINVAEHSAYWSRMEQGFRTFAERRAEVAAVYRAFMYPGGGSGLTDDVGTLDSYFRYFFSYAPGDEDQIVALSEIMIPVFEGLMASEQGREVLAQIIEHAHVSEADKPIAERKNALGIALAGLQAMVTHPQGEVDWALRTGQAIDGVFSVMGHAWALAGANIRYASQLAQRGGFRLSAQAMQHIVDDLVPRLLDVMGLRVTNTGDVRFTTDEVGRLIGKAMQQYLDTLSPADVARILAGDTDLSSRFNLDPLEQRANSTLQNGRRMFDWSNSQRSGSLPRLWQMARVEVTRPAGQRFAFVLTDDGRMQVGLLFESSFAGLSAWANVMTIASLANQSAFERADPLRRGGMIQDALRFGSAVSALTVDVLVLARAAANIGTRGVNLLPTATAVRLAPGLSSGAEQLGRLLAGRLASGLIAIANLAGAVVSAWDAWNAASEGRTGEAVGHAMVALGSVIFFAGAASSLFAGAGASGATGIGLPVAAVLAALGLIVAGIGLIFWFQKGPFENLLFQCFWGKSTNYAFWHDPARDPIEQRIRRAHMNDSHTGSGRNNVPLSYRMELQEFMNFFYMPRLTIDRDTWGLPAGIFTFAGNNDYTLTFNLPNFVPGKSEIIASVRAFQQTTERSRRNPPIVHNEALTNILKDAIQAAVNRSSPVQAGGASTVLTVRVTFPMNCRLVWIYEPVPNTYVPMRMLDGDSLTGGISAEGVLSSPAAGMLGEDPR